MTTTTKIDETIFLNYKESIIKSLTVLIEETKNSANFNNFMQSLENEIPKEEPTFDNLEAYFRNCLWKSEDAIYDIAEEAINA